MKIPLVDLRAQAAEIDDEVQSGWDEVLAETSFILGGPVAEFEREFADFMGADHCIGVGSGTDALEMALRAAGIGEGCEVILPANTFIATALAVVRAGAEPVLVDCDQRFQLIDAQAAEAAVTERTRAIMPVHLFGQIAPMAQLQKVAEAAGIVLIEDAAQSQGAKQCGLSAGNFGLAAGTSFYPGKNIGAYGDAGAVLTNDDDVAQKVRRLRNWGSDIKYHHPEMGFNSRLDTLQAVVLSAKLKRLAVWNLQRRKAAEYYQHLLDGTPGVELPEQRLDNYHVWHLFVVRVAERDRVLGELNEAGIGAGIHYPVPVHLQGAFAYLEHGIGSFPEAEAAAGQILSLPLYPHISPAQQEFVAEQLKKAVRV